MTKFTLTAIKRVLWITWRVNWVFRFQACFLFSMTHLSGVYVINDFVTIGSFRRKFGLNIIPMQVIISLTNFAYTRTSQMPCAKVKFPSNLFYDGKLFIILEQDIFVSIPRRFCVLIATKSVIMFGECRKSLCVSSTTATSSIVGFVCLFVSSSICPCVCMSLCRSAGLSVFLSGRLSTCLSLCPAACLSVCPSICLSVCLCVCFSGCLSVCHSLEFAPRFRAYLIDSLHVKGKISRPHGTIKILLSRLRFLHHMKFTNWTSLLWIRTPHVRHFSLRKPKMNA